MRFLFTGFFVFLFTCSLFAQSVSQLAQNPLLISPSFSGLDSSQRLCLAAQNHRETYDQVSEPYIQFGKALCGSFDRRISGGKSGIGASFQYWDYTEQSLNIPIPWFRFNNPVYSTYIDDYSISARKWEGSLSYVPRFFRLHIGNKTQQLIPAFQVAYSLSQAEEFHFRKRVYNDSTRTYYFWEEKPSYYYPETRTHVYSTTGSKSIFLNRAAFSASLMFKSQRFYVSYQLGLRVDYVWMSYQNYHYDRSYSDTYIQNTEQFEYETPIKWYAQMSNTLALGLYFPKRSNSLIQFHPIAIASYHLSSVQGKWERPMTKSEYYYYGQPMWYDYTDEYGLTLRALCLNGRIWRIIGGVNMTSDTFYAGMIYGYIGYQSKPFTITLGMYNSQSFSGSLQLRF